MSRSNSHQIIKRGTASNGKQFIEYAPRASIDPAIMRLQKVIQKRYKEVIEWKKACATAEKRQAVLADQIDVLEVHLVDARLEVHQYKKRMLNLRELYETEKIRNKAFQIQMENIANAENMNEQAKGGLLKQVQVIANVENTIEQAMNGLKQMSESQNEDRFDLEQEILHDDVSDISMDISNDNRTDTDRNRNRKKRVFEEMSESMDTQALASNKKFKRCDSVAIVFDVEPRSPESEERASDREFIEGVVPAEGVYLPSDTENAECDQSSNAESDQTSNADQSDVHSSQLNSSKAVMTEIEDLMPIKL